MWGAIDDKIIAGGKTQILSGDFKVTVDATGKSQVGDGKNSANWFDELMNNLGNAIQAGSGTPGGFQLVPISYTVPYSPLQQDQGGYGYTDPNSTVVIVHGQMLQTDLGGGFTGHDVRLWEDAIQIDPTHRLALLAFDEVQSSQHALQGRIVYGTYLRTDQAADLRQPMAR